MEPEEIQMRAVTATLAWISGAAYRPRAAALETAMTAMDEARATTLGGVYICAEGSARRFTREYAAVAGTEALPGAPWDGRWDIKGPAEEGDVLRPLGEAGVRACPDWRESGLPRASLAASPGVWQGDRLIAAPLAGFGEGWSARLVPTRARLTATTG